MCDKLCKGFVSKLMDVSLANEVLFGKWRDCLVLQWSGTGIITARSNIVADQFMLRTVITVLIDVQFR